MKQWVDQSNPVSVISFLCSCHNHINLSLFLEDLNVYSHERVFHLNIFTARLCICAAFYANHRPQRYQRERRSQQPFYSLWHPSDVDRLYLILCLSMCIFVACLYVLMCIYLYMHVLWVFWVFLARMGHQICKVQKQHLGNSLYFCYRWQLL